MQKITIALLVFITTIAGCKTSHERNVDEVNADAKRIGELMSEQEKSWNNGDIDGFMKHYWNNDSLRFIGSRGCTYGWIGTRDNYLKSYPDRDAMGRLQFTNLEIDVLGENSAYVVGKWELFRTVGDLSGFYTLLWKKVNGNWVIVADHSS